MGDLNQRLKNIQRQSRPRMGRGAIRWARPQQRFREIPEPVLRYHRPFARPFYGPSLLSSSSLRVRVAAFRIGDWVSPKWILSLVLLDSTVPRALRSRTALEEFVIVADAFVILRSRLRPHHPLSPSRALCRLHFRKGRATRYR